MKTKVAKSATKVKPYLPQASTHNSPVDGILKNWEVPTLKVSYTNKKRTGVTVASAYDAYKVFMSMWDKELIYLQEQVCALFLDVRGNVLGFRTISTGTAEHAVIDIPMILSCALITRASAFIIAHNHPSGDVTPSKNDKVVTQHLMRASTCTSLIFVDHLVLTPSDFYSFKNDSDLF